MKLPALRERTDCRATHVARRCGHSVAGRGRSGARRLPPLYQRLLAWLDVAARRHARWCYPNNLRRRILHTINGTVLTGCTYVLMLLYCHMFVNCTTKQSIDWNSLQLTCDTISLRRGKLKGSKSIRGRWTNARSNWI